MFGCGYPSMIFIANAYKWFKHAHRLVAITYVLVWYGYRIYPLLVLLNIYYLVYEDLSMTTVLMALNVDDLSSNICVSVLIIWWMRLVKCPKILCLVTYRDLASVLLTKT